ncbi:MAG: sigma-70 family RNA polymerase sigma factor [Brevundimonas sp.]|uniref:sigma-70 family RNA polymerase sigma factor n=1 Tax=Brevundimonas sp. TaxID=1871086 RepID=UPI0027354963|nr:sigma-70 family RNA polymerase sigma factor [Brevundimonas sp.]MDP3405580.1 sigma-70 family RNA polymerase sigma factor [Brevundimonas sp.]
MSAGPTPSLAEHLPAMLRFARSLTRDPVAADDLVQDAVLRAIERRDRFLPDRDYRSWLLTITHNLFIDGWRRDRSRRTTPLDADSPFSRAEPDQDHVVDLRATLRAFERLPEDQRAVLHLVVVEGSSYVEAAAMLGIPIGTVMSRLSRARETLRRVTTVPAAPPLRLVSDRDV